MTTEAEVLAQFPDNTTGDIDADNVRNFVGATWERFNGATAVDGIQFDTNPPVPAHTPGHMHWNTTEGIPEVMTNITGVVLQIGHELFAEVRNNSGATIPNGRAVRVTGGIATRPTIGLDNGEGGILGLTTHEIANNSNGKVTLFGLIRDVNTSSFSEGDTLYSSSTGTLTTSITSSFVGYVTDSHVSSGTILASRLRADAASGTTAQRPTTRALGFRYFDNDLGFPIWWNGADWVDSTGSVV
jgi:hypothetical protein